MKEFLNIASGEYKQAECMFSHSNWIEIPKGAEVAMHYKSGEIEFFKENYAYFWFGKFQEWKSTENAPKFYESASVIWKRPTHPEPLPFIDDEPQSINDQYAEIEQVRQHRHYFKDVSNIDEIDVYMVLKLFNVTDPCLQHIAKKALCAGRRGHKDFKKDLQDILDTAVRAVDINK